MYPLWFVSLALVGVGVISRVWSHTGGPCPRAAHAWGTGLVLAGSALQSTLALAVAWDPMTPAARASALGLLASAVLATVAGSNPGSRAARGAGRARGARHVADARLHGAQRALFRTGVSLLALAWSTLIALAWLAAHR